MIVRIARSVICAAIGERMFIRAITPISPVRICVGGSIRVRSNAWKRHRRANKRGERIGTRSKMRAKVRLVIIIRCVTVVAG